MKKINVLIIIPIYNREGQALNCIRSLVDTTIVSNAVNITIALAANEMNQLLRDYLTSYIPTARYKIDVHDMGSNVGKGIAVNNVASKYAFDYLVSMDSDMICLDPNWLMKMIKAYMLYNEKPYRNSQKNNEPRYLGSLCTNQIGMSAHLVKLGDPGTLTNHPSPELSIVTPMNGAGIAGGVLMTDSSTWKLIGGYNGSRLFAADDGHYHGDCYSKNRLVGFLHEVSFYHPHELNDQYRIWKNEMVTSPYVFNAHKTEVLEL